MEPSITDPNVSRPVRPHHPAVDAPHGRGRHPWRPHRHHFPRQAVLRWILALPEDPAGNGLLPDPGQKRLRLVSSVLQELRQYRVLQQEDGKGTFQETGVLDTAFACTALCDKYHEEARVYLALHSASKPHCLCSRRTVCQRAVQMLVLAVNQKVKPPQLVKTTCSTHTAGSAGIFMIYSFSISLFLLTSFPQMCPSSPM